MSCAQANEVWGGRRTCEPSKLLRSKTLEDKIPWNKRLVQGTRAKGPGDPQETAGHLTHRWRILHTRLGETTLLDPTRAGERFLEMTGEETDRSPDSLITWSNCGWQKVWEWTGDKYTGDGVYCLGSWEGGGALEPFPVKHFQVRSHMCVLIRGLTWRSCVHWAVIHYTFLHREVALDVCFCGHYSLLQYYPTSLPQRREVRAQAAGGCGGTSGRVSGIFAGRYHWKGAQVWLEARTPGACEAHTDQEVAEPAITETSSGGDNMVTFWRGQHTLWGALSLQGQSSRCHLQGDILFRE